MSHWPWRRVRQTGGREARERAERDLEAVRAETARYAELARDLRTIRERNHLALAFFKAAGGKSE